MKHETNPTGIMSLIDRFKKTIRGEWRYKGITNLYMDKHSWANGSETVDVFYMTGAAHHAGFVVEATRENRDGTLVISNGFVRDPHKALILADLYMRDDAQTPAAFMYSDRVDSDFGMGNSVRQDEWLDAHAHDYKFAVIDPDEVGFERI